MAFIYDLIDPQELLGYVRTLSFAQFSLVNYTQGLPPAPVIPPTLPPGTE